MKCCTYSDLVVILSSIGNITSGDRAKRKNCYLSLRSLMSRIAPYWDRYNGSFSFFYSSRSSYVFLLPRGSCYCSVSKSRFHSVFVFIIVSGFDAFALFLYLHFVSLPSSLSTCLGSHILCRHNSVFLWWEIRSQTVKWLLLADPID